MLEIRTDAGLGEAVGDRLTVLDDIGDDVLAEVAARGRVGGVAAQRIEQELGVEDVDAHRGEGEIRLVGNGRRVGRLLDEGDDLVLVVDMHDAEADRFHARHFQQPMVTSAPESTCCCSIHS